MAKKGDGPPIIGIDLGGTKILAGVVSGDDRILARAKRTTPAKEGGAAILAAAISCVDEALSSAGVSRKEIGAAGIGCPGP
jgi:glucokinase